MLLLFVICLKSFLVTYIFGLVTLTIFYNMFFLSKFIWGSKALSSVSNGDSHKYDSNSSQNFPTLQLPLTTLT